MPGYLANSNLKILVLGIVLLTAQTSSWSQTNTKAYAFYERSRVNNSQISTRPAALNDINRAIALEPTNGKFWLQKAIIYTLMEEQEQALPCINKAIQYDKKNAAAWETKGTILMGLSRYPEALEVMNEAVRLNPDPKIRITHADVLMRMNRIKEAEAELDEMVKVAPADAMVRQRRSRVASLNNHWQKVVDDMTTVIKSRPDRGVMYTNALMLRARAYSKLKRYDRAVADAKEGLKHSPDDRPLHEELLNAYKLSGDTKSATREKYILNNLDTDFVPFK